ncbi:MAG: DUF3368 domain-containing protein [Acidobacteria bacterium]|nr:DUF3368 domain-containing protein [Acidobacteriota bacterium]
MIVISNTTPLNYLVLIGCAELLTALYQRIVIPEAVSKELQAVGPSNPVGIWLASSPSWLECGPVAIPSDLALSGLRRAGSHYPGARTQSRSYPDGRREAERRHLRVVGTLGVLAEAAAREFINLPQTVEKL